MTRFYSYLTLAVVLPAMVCLAVCGAGCLGGHSQGTDIQAEKLERLEQNVATFMAKADVDVDARAEIQADIALLRQSLETRQDAAPRATGFAAMALTTQAVGITAIPLIVIILTQVWVIIMLVRFLRYKSQLWHEMLLAVLPMVNVENVKRMMKENGH